MGWQKDEIQERANRLGIDSGDSSHQLDHMKKIAEAVGMSDYNGLSNADADELERRLKEMEKARAAENKAANQHKANINANANNLRNAADVAMATKNPYALGIGGAIKAADKMTGGKSSEVLGKAMEKELKRSPFGGLMQKASNKLSESGASDAIGKAASMKNGDMSSGKSDNTNKKTKDTAGQGSGDIVESAISKGLLFKILLFFGCLCFVMTFFICLISAVYDLRLSSVIMGSMTAEDRELLNDVIDEIGEGSEVGTGDVDMTIYYERLKALGNVFSSEFECEEDDCSDRPEVRYYLKVADIALRYKNKYHVNLDWVLLNATMMFSDLDEEATMERALNDYDLDEVEDYDKLMNLDWDYDYENIPGYKYLSPDDFRYDLQILAKNMVTKTTTQTCTKVSKDSDGNTVREVTNQRIDTDIEDKYLEKGKEYYLKCKSGEEYNISSVYRYDAEKYDEFLLEYIERKYYMPSDTGIDPITGETDMTPSEASGDYIFPLPAGATSCRSSAYGPRIHPITGKYSDHSGDDYPAAGGTPVYAVKDGVVSSIGTGCIVGDMNCHGGMGNNVIIDHGNGITSIYMHATKVYVTTGQEVKQGDVIMSVGTTGSSTGNHLHITFKKNGVKDNPANYIGALPMC